MSQYRTNRRNHGALDGQASALSPFKFAQYTLACERHPDRNEDSIIIDEASGLVAVFDGVGGSAAGEIASRIAARATHEGWKHTLQQIQKGRNIQSLLEDRGQIDLNTHLEQLIHQSDEQVRIDGAQRAGTNDLATTIALAVLLKKPGESCYTMFYAHVGDSRIYLLREHAPLQRLTEDDGLLGKLVENQIVNDSDAHRIDQAMHADELSDVEFSYFRLRGGITQALGGPLPPSIHIDSTSIQPGDRVLLCTDGIHDNLTEEEIEETLRTGARTAVARLLVERALQRSREERHATIRAKPDDMSAIVVTCRF